MKRIYDVETMSKGNTYREAVEAESFEEAYEIIFERHPYDRVVRITERKTT
jgi:hypothetical protein